MRPKHVILLVEDSDDDVFLFRRAVQRSGCNVDVCHCPSTNAAIQHLESLRSTGGVLPSLVFIDLYLPDLCGTHLVTWMKQRPEYRGIPLIIMTGSPSPTIKQELATSGANAVTLKPATNDELAECISSAWLKYGLPS